MTSGGVYCVRVELFEQYVLPISVPAQFTLSNLLKLSNQQPNQNKTLSYPEWVSIAGSSLGLSEGVAAAMFEAYCSYTMAAHDAMNHTRDELMWRQSGSVAEWRKERLVSLPHFLLFIFCQSYPAFSPTAVSSAWGSNLPSQAAEGHLKYRSTEHERICTFITQHLYHLLTLLAPKYKITSAQITALELVLTEVDPSGGSDKHLTPSAQPFGSLMPFWWMDKTAAVDIHLISTHINENLKPPTRMGYLPYEICSTKHSPKAVWPESPRQNAKTVVVRGVSKNMFYRMTAPSQAVENVQIYMCTSATIYLLGCYSNVTIFGCSHCTVILGAVSGVVAIESSDNMKVVSASRALSLQDVATSRIYALVNTPPLVFSGCAQTSIAPYNTHYPAFEEHLKASGLNPLLNLWSQLSILSSSSATSSVTQLPVDQFTSITIPFTNHPGETHTNPCAMPAEYHDELKKKASVATQTCNLLRQAVTSKDGANSEMARQITEKFKTWLQDSGNIRHVLELLHYDDES
eukprot:TRINITY_DN32145_c0_g1_i1.p1 TRINITY_DN32145_c0_g1~~TRINITY_DN32145_c0_g1_i1.p1  ORF type:complete len:518 (+),score=174.96 TRINITY_DN32145_c0_g1_i1:83-1636(+)